VTTTRYTLPKNAGTFRVQEAMGGNYIVTNDKMAGT